MNPALLLSFSAAIVSAIIGLFQPIIADILKDSSDRKRKRKVFWGILLGVLFLLLLGTFYFGFSGFLNFNGVSQEYSISMGGPDQKVVFTGVGTLSDEGKPTGYGEIHSNGETQFYPVYLQDSDYQVLEYYDQQLIYRGEITNGLPDGVGEWFFPESLQSSQPVILSGQFESGAIEIATHYDKDGTLLFYGRFAKREGGEEFQRWGPELPNHLYP